MNDLLPENAVAWLIGTENVFAAASFAAHASVPVVAV
jgi:hypothetical protein